MRYYLIFIATMQPIIAITMLPNNTTISNEYILCVLKQLLIWEILIFPSDIVRARIGAIAIVEV